MLPFNLFTFFRVLAATVYRTKQVNEQPTLSILHGQ